jgi:hypothetical protein
MFFNSNSHFDFLFRERKKLCKGSLFFSSAPIFSLEGKLVFLQVSGKCVCVCVRVSLCLHCQFYSGVHFWEILQIFRYGVADHRTIDSIHFPVVPHEQNEPLNAARFFELAFFTLLERKRLKRKKRKGGKCKKVKMLAISQTIDKS